MSNYPEYFGSYLRELIKDSAKHCEQDEYENTKQLISSHLDRIRAFAIRNDITSYQLYGVNLPEHISRNIVGRLNDEKYRGLSYHLEPFGRGSWICCKW